MSVRALLRGKPGEVFTVASSAKLADAARALVEHGIGGLPVVDDGELVGFVSEREIVRTLHRSDDPYVRDVGVASIMRSPAPTCDADDPIRGVMERMTGDRLRHLVVLDGTRIAGVISVGDLVKHRLGELETETGVLRDYVAAQRAKR